MKHTAHTKGHYGIEDPEIKFNKKRRPGGLIRKGAKVQKHKKVLKWHGNEEQTNIYVYHVLQSCGVQAISYLKTKVIIKFTFWPKQSYLDLKI